jgi:amino acid transporter
MELKKVNNVISKGYAKKDEISKKEIKKFIPSKWIAASSAGLVTLFYTSPKNGLQKIGIVFGCVSINYPMRITSSIANIFGVVSGGLGIFLMASIIDYFIHRKKYDEDKKTKEVKYLKIMATTLATLIAITIMFGAISYMISNSEKNQDQSLLKYDATSGTLDPASVVPTNADC